MPYNRTRASEELAMNHLGLKNLEGVFWNLPTPRLYEHAAYVSTAKALAERFKKAFSQFEDETSDALLLAGPR